MGQGTPNGGVVSGQEKCRVLLPEHFEGFKSEKQQVWAHVRTGWVLPPSPRVQPNQKASQVVLPDEASSALRDSPAKHFRIRKSQHACMQGSPGLCATKSPFRLHSHWEEQGPPKEGVGRGGRGGGDEEAAHRRCSVHYHMNSQALGGEASSWERAWLIRRPTDWAPEKEPDLSGDSHSLEKINTHWVLFEHSASVHFGRIPPGLFQLLLNFHSLSSSPSPFSSTATIKQSQTVQPDAGKQPATRELLTNR